MQKWIVLIAFLTGLAGPAFGANRQEVEDGFQTWLQQVVTPRALAEGISPETVKAAFTDVTLNWVLSGLVFPGMDPPEEQEEGQAEFRAPAKYFRQDRLQGTANIGRTMAQRHDGTLKMLQDKTGVPGRILLAIWARESGFGRVPITHDAFQVLATRAYASDDDYLTRELIGALEVAQQGHVPVRDMKSSWAGALGQPQFMPRSFLAYGADGDGDGRVDIWRSADDTLASIANFLLVHGWDKTRDWGYEVQVPQSVSCTLEGPDQGRPLAEWEALGVRRISGKAFPVAEQRGDSFLMLPAGRQGPAFLVTPNFYVLKRYNRSDLYALYVGHLGDRIQFGLGDFAAGWADMGKIYRSDIARLQQGLESQGHDVGGADGLPGFKTRRAIGRWQEADGQSATCFPEPWMADAVAQ